MSYDLGNYLCECAIDNSYSKSFGIKLYLSNLPTKEERLNLLTTYLTHYFNEVAQKNSDYSEMTFEKYLSEMLPKFDEEVKQCMLLSCFNWGVWSLTILKEEDICN